MPHNPSGCTANPLRFAVAAASGIFAAGTAQAQQADQPSGSGEDILAQYRRIDLRAEASSTGSSDEFRLTLRHDHRVELGDGWRINFRIDAPLVFTKKKDEGGAVHKESGVGDLLFQAVIVRQLSSKQGFGFGAQLLAPTAGKDSLGTGKWRLRPTVGYRWPILSISDTSFFQLIAKYDFSFAGDEDRNDVRQLQLAPNLEIGLKDDAYISFFPSADIRYNFVRDEWFVPVNVEVGKEWGRLVTSVEGAAGVIKGDHPPYDWKIEGRVGLRF